jgi:hypothetical protein
MVIFPRRTLTTLDQERNDLGLTLPESGRIQPAVPREFFLLHGFAVRRNFQLSGEEN